MRLASLAFIAFLEGSPSWFPNSILTTKPFAPAQLVTALSQLLNSGTATT
jgi:hypothetical protein